MATLSIRHNASQWAALSVQISNTAESREADAKAIYDAFDEHMNAAGFPAKLYNSNMAKLNELGAVEGLKALGYQFTIGC